MENKITFVLFLLVVIFNIQVKYVIGNQHENLDCKHQCELYKNGDSIEYGNEHEKCICNYENQHKRNFVSGPYYWEDITHFLDIKFGRECAHQVYPSTMNSYSDEKVSENPKYSDSSNNAHYRNNYETNHNYGYIIKPPTIDNGRYIVMKDKNTIFHFSPRLFDVEIVDYGKERKSESDNTKKFNIPKIIITEHDNIKQENVTHNLNETENLKQNETKTQNFNNNTKSSARSSEGYSETKMHILSSENGFGIDDASQKKRDVEDFILKSSIHDDKLNPIVYRGNEICHALKDLDIPCDVLYSKLCESSQNNFAFCNKNQLYY